MPYKFSRVLVWDNSAGVVRLARNVDVRILDPATGLTAPGLAVDGQPVQAVRSDHTGRIDFTADIGAVQIVPPAGIPVEQTSPDMLAEASTAAARAEAAEQAAQAAAALVGAPAKAAMDAAMGGDVAGLVPTVTGLGSDVGALQSSLGGKVSKGELVISVRDYGAVGDGVTDDLPAFQAAYTAAFASSTFGTACLFIPRGKYRLGDEWDIYRPNAPRRDLVIRGESQWSTFVLAGFYGAGKALIKCVDPAGATRCSPTSLYDLQLGTVDRDGPSPVLLDVYGAGESRYESIRFGSSNNTHLRLASLQNVRMRDIVSFYGGKHFDYRDTTGITFTSTSGSSTLTASASIFTALDPGRTISLHRADGTRAKYRISSYVSGTEVVINPATPAITLTGVPGFFEPARITTTAGSNQVSANAQVFTPDDLGRVIYIKGAKNGAYGPALLRGRITEYVSGATVRLDVTADRALTRTEFGVPVVDLYTPNVAGTLGAGSNDVKVELLHVENYAGIGLVVQNSVFMHVNDAKIHGEQTPTSAWSSQAQMWLDDYGGIISGELDGAALGPARIYVCNLNDLLTFDWLATKRVVNGQTFEMETMTDPGGIAEVRTFNAYQATASADPYDLVTDPNSTPRLVFTGLVNMLGDSAEPRIYSGRHTYHSLTGNMVIKSPNGTRYRIAVSDTGTLSAAVVTTA